MTDIIRAREQHISDICRLWLEFVKYSENIDPIYAVRDEIIPIFEKEYLRPAMQDNNSLVLVAVDGKTSKCI